jgi:methylenetetrahydrofolate reductase (NADPH)
MTRIVDLLGGPEPTFSFEFFPPRTPEGETNFQRALKELAPLDPTFVSVTYGAGGTTREKTVDTVRHIKDELGLEAMAHFTCVGATTEELRVTLEEIRDAGVENVLALRGDPPRGQSEWVASDGGLEFSHQLVALLSKDYDFSIAAACFPETHIHATSP